MGDRRREELGHNARYRSDNRSSREFTVRNDHELHQHEGQHNVYNSIDNSGYPALPVMDQGTYGSPETAAMMGLAGLSPGGFPMGMPFMPNFDPYGTPYNHAMMNMSIEEQQMMAAATAAMMANSLMFMPAGQHNSPAQIAQMYQSMMHPFQNMQHGYQQPPPPPASHRPRSLDTIARDYDRNNSRSYSDSVYNRNEIDGYSNVHRDRGREHEEYTRRNRQESRSSIQAAEDYVSGSREDYTRTIREEFPSNLDSVKDYSRGRAYEDYTRKSREESQSADHKKSVNIDYYRHDDRPSTRRSEKRYNAEESGEESKEYIRSRESSTSDLRQGRQTLLQPRARSLSPIREDVHKKDGLELSAESQKQSITDPINDNNKNFYARSTTRSREYSRNSESPLLLNGEEEVKTPSRMLFCRSVSKTLSQIEFRRIFEKYGHVSEMNLTHLSGRGIAFIGYHDIRSAIKAKAELNGRQIDNRIMHVHYSKPKEWEDTASVCKRESNQGTLLVEVARSQIGDLDLAQLEALFSEYGPIRAVFEAELVGKRGKLIEFFDIRHALAAKDALDGSLFGNSRLRVSYEWEVIRFPGVNHKLINEIIGTYAAKEPVKPVNFFIDNKGDAAKKAMVPDPTSVDEILEHQDLLDPKPSTSSPVCYERIEMVPPEPIKRQEEKEKKPVASEANIVLDSAEGNDVTSSPYLLAQMSDLLSSLQKPKASVQTQEKKVKDSPGKPAVPVKATTGAISTGGVVSSKRGKKEPSLESVQELAKLLLQQTRTNL